MAGQPFCRLTVLAPRHRVDVALPSDVPVAELVPMVLELVGEPGRRRGAAAVAAVGHRRVARCPRRPRWTSSACSTGSCCGSARPPRCPRRRCSTTRSTRWPRAPPPGARDTGSRRPSCSRWRWPRRSCSARAGPARCRAALLAGAGAVGARSTAAGRLAQRGGDPAHAGARPRRRARRGRAGRGGRVGRRARSAGSGAAHGGRGRRRDRRGRRPAAAAGGGARAGRRGRRRRRRRRGRDRGAAAAPPRWRRPPAVAALAVVAAPLLPRAAIRLAGLPRPVVPADETELTGDDARRCRPPSSPNAPTSPAATSPGSSGRRRCSPGAGALVAAAAGGWAGPAFAGRHRGGAAAARPRLRRRRTGPHRAGGRHRRRRVGLAAPSARPGSPPSLVACAVLLSGRGRPSPRSTPRRAGCDPSCPRVLRRTVDLVEGVLVAAAVPLALAAMDLFQLVRGL